MIYSVIYAFFGAVQMMQCPSNRCAEHLHAQLCIGIKERQTPGGCQDHSAAVFGLSIRLRSLQRNQNWTGVAGYIPKSAGRHSHAR